MTLQECEVEFRKMWNWIADETEKQKRFVGKIEYFNNNGKPIPIELCYCCEYTKALNGKNCGHCPCTNPTDERFLCADGLYSKWRHCFNNDDYINAAKFAKKIANFEFRKDV